MHKPAVTITAKEIGLIFHNLFSYSYVTFSLLRPEQDIEQAEYILCYIILSNQWPQTHTLSPASRSTKQTASSRERRVIYIFRIDQI